MRLALLGSDEEALALAQAIVASPLHQLVVAYEPRPEHQDTLATSLRQGGIREDWESLLHSTEVDGVIVARPEQQAARDEQLRKLVQAAMPLLILHPACEAIVGLELDMIRRDTGCVLVPFSPGRWHPGLERLVRLATADSDPPLGPLEQITFERALVDRGRQNVLDQLARDVSLLRPVMGEINKMTATGADASSASLANLAVSLTGRDGLIARWTVLPADRTTSGQLTLVGGHARAVLQMPAGSPWVLSIGGDQPQEVRFPEWSEPSAALAEFDKAISGKAPVPAWIDTCRDLEVADTVEISIRRGRTLDLSTETPTEEGTFKGVMAVGSCALLLLTLLVLLVGSVIEGMLLPRQRAEYQRQAREQRAGTPDGSDRLPSPGGERPSAWPLVVRLWPVYPFAIFLLLQLLRLVFRAPSSVRPARSDPRKFGTESVGRSGRAQQ